MVKKELSKNIANATKWATITEFVAKIFVPVTNMILARLLTPEAFGVVATVTMIISFADMLTDSGFQKYLIQHEFNDKREKIQSINVAFWTNMVISLVLWFIMVIFSEPIATVVGNQGLGIVIAVAGISLPLTSITSIQMAIFRRDFDYKTLFYVRIIGVCLPFIVTIPLAILGTSYWSIIVGTICGNLANAILLLTKSSWKPKLYYSFDVLKKMLSFSIWSLVESISIWLTSYIGIFIVSSVLNSYYLGLYRTTMVTVNGILALVTTATTSVLFSSLSRLQNDEIEYERVFLKFIRLVSLLVFPMGIGIFLYRDLVTDILLGKQWEEASLFVGIWGLMSSITIVLGQYCSEIYRSKGRPEISFLVQILHLLALVPTLMISVRYGFEALIYGTSFIKLNLILVNWLVIYFVFRMSPLLIVKNVFPSIISSFFMGILAYMLQLVSNNVIWDLISIGFCVIFYFSIIIKFPKIRSDLLSVFSSINLPFKEKLFRVIKR